MRINCSVCGTETRVNTSNKSKTCSGKCRAAKKRIAKVESEEELSTCCGYPEHHAFTGLCSRCLDHADFETE